MMWVYRVFADPRRWLGVVFVVGIMAARWVPSAFYDECDPRQLCVYQTSAAIWAAVWAVGFLVSKLKLKWAIATGFLGVALMFGAMAGRDILWRIYFAQGTPKNAASFVVLSHWLDALMAMGVLVAWSMGLWVLYRLKRIYRCPEEDLL